MANLSPEVFQLILNELRDDPYDGPETLRNLRLVSKTVNTITTPVFFCVVPLWHDLDSANAVLFLQDCDESIRAAVREVVFEDDSFDTTVGDWRGGRAMRLAHGQSPFDAYKQSILKRNRTALFQTFSGLAKFPNLERLRLAFHSSYEEEPSATPIAPSHYLLQQIALFKALVHNPPPPLTSLVMTDIIGIHQKFYESEKFLAIFRTLKKLEISVLSVAWDDPHPDFLADPEEDDSYELLEAYWGGNMIDMVRSSVSLTSLTVCSDQPVGGDLYLNLDIFLPQLSELVLKKFVLSPESPSSDAVTFILWHKSLLSRLELRDCSVDSIHKDPHAPIGHVHGMPSSSYSKRSCSPPGILGFRCTTGSRTGPSDSRIPSGFKTVLPDATLVTRSMARKEICQHYRSC
ncbi:hypothetical protein FB45DRAFT_361830 [Roridomyces roridus]|uniref:Uncharacterized protein n=1 Tax=Roridomyces roridus TaxID=1738132 RepID=A0AAD7C869_9AGAR|nr:hypothetical protein FB45DRAFT_361830 [Roridomyces roridus]